MEQALPYCPFTARQERYVISVRQARDLPVVSLFSHPASFRFHLATDTFAFGCILPTTGADSGLSPVRLEKGSAPGGPILFRHLILPLNVKPPNHNSTLGVSFYEITTLYVCLSAFFKRISVSETNLSLSNLPRTIPGSRSISLAN